MSISNRRAVSFVVSAGLCLSLSGCVLGARSLPEPAAYSCTWTSDSGDTFTLVSDGEARLSISADLLLETLGPAGRIPELRPGQRFTTDDAIWTIGNGTFYEYNGAPQLQITWFSSSGNHAWLVDVERDGEDVRLLAPRVEADQYDRVSFLPSDC